MTIILFLLVLFVLILVHEWGHFIVAKKTGMRVDEFGIGFPPKMYGIKKGETEYSFNALPIGGFVKIYGENLEEIPGDEVDKARAFGSRPKWAQALVLVAGVAMNVLFAWFLFFVVFMLGTPTAVEESVATDEAVLYVSGVLPGSPLYEKLSAGSEILSVGSADDELMKPTPSTFTEFIQAHADEELSINYKNGDDTGTVNVTPETGLIPGEESKAAVGVSLALVETVPRSFFTAIVDSFFATVNGLEQIVTGLYSLLVGAVSGTADLSQVAGPVGIVNMVGDAAQFGVVALLTFTAVISLNLAVINLLPIPALDGGRLVFVAIEAVTRRPINPNWAGHLNLIGFALLMLLMIVVTYNDIVRLFTN
ncbi:MAG: RIP metalloprotease RseP [Candidatus Nomurabacteria bacterium]|nr:RIP metalloprotease RseP [Candidatus Nomurabacteria bacterium]USN87974.1 MAG: RIP metalloprotease RseP [Candidatus Nomurabacteria bacterium]